MVSPDKQSALAAWSRFVLWMVIGALVGLVMMIFLTLALWVPLVVGVVAVARPGWRTGLGGLLAGLALPVAYFGSWVGARDRECNSGSIDSNGVETCTQWVQAGSIRWPWFLAAGALLVIGVSLQWWARRRARRGLQAQELEPGAWLSPG
jgi:hypothetical protein